MRSHWSLNANMMEESRIYVYMLCHLSNFEETKRVIIWSDITLL